MCERQEGWSAGCIQPGLSMGISPPPTSSSGEKNCVLIDFGLSLVPSDIEARGVDLHVFFQTLESTKGIA